MGERRRVTLVVSTVWTLGHSNHEPNGFVNLLHQQDITAVADLRSHPYSRHVPQYGKEELAALLKASGISYVFLGRELGARSNDDTVFAGDRVDFDKLATTDLFRAGLERIRGGSERHRIALVCAEQDPLHCHRAILVARHLLSPALDVRHIHPDGHTESQAELETRMLDHLGLAGGDLFTPLDVQLAEAYTRQGAHMAWRRPAEDGGPEDV